MRWGAPAPLLMLCQPTVPVPSTLPICLVARARCAKSVICSSNSARLRNRVMQFAGSVLDSLFPPPETGEGEGGGEGWWSAQAVLLPPIPTFPRQGGRGRRPREKRGKSRTAWPCLRNVSHCKKG